MPTEYQQQPQGSFRVIRANGTEEVIARKPTIKDITRIIGCEYLDSVTLNKDVVMLLDDVGALEPQRPFNQRATQIAYGDSGGMLFGDAVIVNDLDFATDANPF
jgi:hypothetical protein